MMIREICMLIVPCVQNVDCGEVSYNIYQGADTGQREGNREGTRMEPLFPRSATAGQIRKAAVRGGAARKRGVDLNEGDRLVGGTDPLANPIPSRRFSARLLAKARLAVFVERPEVAADYIVTEKKDGRESSSLRSDSPDEMGNSMIDSRKKTGTPTLASALTAQNKDDGVHNIDALEVPAVVDFVDNIYDFYRHAEKCGRPCKYMDFQADINEEKRSMVADRLIEVHHSFGLMSETLYLTFHIIDQYLSKEKVSGMELPLVGINALLIASKYEESRSRKNIDYDDILCHAYTKEQMLAKEREIMKTLKWKLSVPTQYVFLVCFLKAAMCDKELEHMVFFLAELGLMHYSMITYWPSLAAASAVYAARSTLKRTPLWTETLMHQTGYSEQQLRKCAQQLVIFHSSAAESTLQAVYKKYSSTKFGAVALHPPATELLRSKEDRQFVYRATLLPSKGSLRPDRYGPSLKTTRLEQVVFFLSELGLMHYSMVTYCPSLAAAASAVYAAARFPSGLER
ncbi:hypothetical protein C4D60_Mb07t25900 [Musa balbisiana]|uniref:Cyclin N-terminal domain-containing protein n=1 Tax=Musa balbisiana TaxID=52838 RepID=A0A4S8JI12_MUSBA|nr:hypothetical protein C4D60_Mb07t25900 [Musa balbisiana]